MRAKYAAKTPGERHHDVEFAGMNEDLDAGVGRLVQAIDDLGIADNTYIFFTSDNGFQFDKKTETDPMHHKAWPLSCCKLHLEEGGIRVPFIVRGPGVPKAAISRMPVIGYDLMPTILELINAKLPRPEGIEGGSLVTAIHGEIDSAIKRPHNHFVFHYPNGVLAIRTAIISGDYKLFENHAPGTVNLFDLSADMSEQKDLATDIPEKVEEIQGVLHDYLDSIDAIKPELQRTGKRKKR